MRRFPSRRAFLRATILSLFLLICGNASTASAAGPFPIDESFANPTAPGWNLGGVAKLTAAPGNGDTAGNGWLRLTGLDASVSGYGYYDTPFPTSDGVSVEFDYATYGGTGADGLTFFLYDGTTTAANFRIGAFGGSLGYTGCNSGSTVPGLRNAYIGVGFDEYGNFTNLASCGVDGAVTNPNYVSVRGSAANNYAMLTSQAVPGGLTGDRSAPRHVTISITPSGKLTVTIKFPNGTLQTITSNYQLPAAPTTLKLGYAASTGGSNNYHEIRSTHVVKPTDFTTSLTDGNTGTVRTGPNTWTSVVTNTGPNPTESETFTATSTQSLTGVSWTCTPSAGASCGAAATGTGLPTAVVGGAVPINGTLTYTITGTPAAATDYAQLTVSATPTGDTGELSPANNVASDTTDLTPIIPGAPTFTLSAGGVATATRSTPVRGGNIVNTQKWQRCDPDGTNCADIAGATGLTYSTTTADRGSTLRFVQVATNAALPAVSANSAHYASLPDTAIANTPVAISSSTSASPTFSSPTGGATFECRLDGGTWTACTSPRSLTGLAQGSHTFDVRAVYGGLSDPTPETTTWTVDSLAPDTSIDSGPTGVVNVDTASIAFSGTDAGTGVASYECKLDTAPYAPCTSPRALTGLADGTHTLLVRAIDGAGNTDASPASRSWTVDTVDPSASITIAPAASSGTANPTFSFTGSDPGGSGVASYECRLDGGSWTTCTSPRPLTGLADGPHTFDVRSVDAGGNRSTPATHGWSIDTTDPTTTLTDQPIAITASSDASFAFTGADTGGSGVASFECKLDAGTWAACTSPRDLAGLTDGDHTFQIRAIDNLGHKDATPASYTWTVDTAVPTVTITQAPDALVASASATFEFGGGDGTGTGIASYECQLDGGTWTTCTSPATYPGLTDGDHTFKVRGIDGAGLVSPADTHTWTIDTTGPTTTPEGPAPNAAVPGRQPTLTFTGEPGSTIVITIDGIPSAPITVPASGIVEYTPLVELADGPHTVTATSTDTLGNVGNPSPLTTIRVLATAPVSPTIPTVPAPASADPNPTFVFAVGPGQTLECKLDSGEWAPCDPTVSFPGLPDGPHTVEVRQVNEAGVRGEPKAYSWTVDTTPPARPVLVRQPETLTKAADARFEFSPEPGTTVQCSVDGGAFVDCSAGLSLSSLKLGVHRLRMKQTDAAGNVSAEQEYSWTVGTKAKGGVPTKLTARLAKTAVVRGSRGFTVGCTLDRGSLKTCATKAYATVGGKHVMVGTGSASNTKQGLRYGTVRVKLNAAGRKLLAKRVNGLPVRLAVAGSPFAYETLGVKLRTRLYPERSVIIPVIWPFDTAAALLTNQGRTTTLNIAIKAKKARYITCVGHTDSRGSAARNVALGLERARSACAALKRLGVTAQSSSQSWGAARPRATNATAKGRRLNRRVEVIVRY